MRSGCADSLPFRTGDVRSRPTMPASANWKGMRSVAADMGRFRTIRFIGSTIGSVLHERKDRNGRLSGNGTAVEPDRTCRQWLTNLSMASVSMSSISVIPDCLPTKNGVSPGRSTSRIFLVRDDRERLCGVHSSVLLQVGSDVD